jgi:hypothetical protein
VKEEYFGYYESAYLDSMEKKSGFVGFIIIFTPMLYLLITLSFAIVGYHILFNKEMFDKSYGSWLSLPIGRNKIFLTKLLVIICYSFLFMFTGFFLSTIIPFAKGLIQANGIYFATNLVNFLSLFSYQVLFISILLTVEHLIKMKYGFKLGLAIFLMLDSVIFFMIKQASISLLMAKSTKDISTIETNFIILKKIFYLQYLSPSFLVNFNYFPDMNNLVQVFDKHGALSLQYISSFAKINPLDYGYQIPLMILISSSLLFWYYKDVKKINYNI